MKKQILKIVSVASAAVMMVQMSAFAFGGTYPEHPEYAGLTEQSSLSKYSYTTTDENYIFGVDGKKFILLDTDAEGNYFVLTEDLYGHKAFDTTYSKSRFVIETATEGEDGTLTYTAGDVSELDESRVLFSTTDETNIGYWLNNDFLTSGNGSAGTLPKAIQDNLIETEWAVEGMNGAILGWQAKDYYDNLKGETTGADFAASRVIEPFTVTGKVALMSATEYKKYQDIIGFSHNEDIWKGLILRTPMSQLGGTKTTSALDSSKSIPQSLTYTWGTAMVKNYGTAGSSDQKMVICYNDSGHNTNMFVRPCFWLDKDFFKTVKVEIEGLGQYPKTEILSNSQAELEAIGYTAAEIVDLIGVEPSWDWGHYPSHDAPATWVKEEATVADGIVGESPAENLFTIGGRRFILLDRNLNGEYFIMADEEYGQMNMLNGDYLNTIYAREGKETTKGWDSTDWLYNPTLTDLLAWKLNNPTWGLLAGDSQFGMAYQGGYTGDTTRKVIPTEMLDDLVEWEWEIEPFYPVTSWTFGSHANETSVAEKEAWWAEKVDTATKQSVTAKVVLMSATEYNTYKNKIGFVNYPAEAPYARNILRTTSGSIAGVESTGEWTFTPGYAQVGLDNKDQTTVKWAYATMGDNKYMARPVMWLAKDFFKNNKIDVATAGATVRAEMNDLYTAEDLAETYTKEEIIELGIIDEVTDIAYSATDLAAATDVTVTAKVANLGESRTAILGVYNNGRLVGVELKNVDFTDVELGTSTDVSLSAAGFMGADTCKLMLWKGIGDNDALIPVYSEEYTGQ